MVKMLDTKEAADFLKISTDTLLRKCKKPDDSPGSIPHVKLSARTYRFNQSDLETWLQKRCPSADEFYKWKEAQKVG